MKKTLVIMGTHPKAMTSFNWSRTDCEIWMFNEAPNAKTAKGELLYPPKADAVIQLHHEAIWKNPKNRSDKEHYQWLTSGNTPTVYMQETYKEVPKSVRYPIENVLSLLDNVRMVVNGKEKKLKYFSSSPDFALALVAQMWKQGKRYDRVEIWGIELETQSEYEYQRTGFGFWTGYLAALGIELVLYNSIFDSPMYGYEGDVAITSDYLEKRITELTAEFGNRKELYTQEANAFLISLSELLEKNISKDIETKMNELTKKYEKYGILNGKIKEAKRYLEKAEAMEKASGASVFSMGEFDQMRHNYIRQQDMLRAEALNLNSKIGFVLSKLVNMKKGSQKRQRALDEFGQMVADLMNKNMLILHMIGGAQENQHYIDSIKFSIRASGGEK